MSRRLSALVVVVVVVAGGAVFVNEFFRPLRQSFDEFFDQGLLGPEDQRQRVEVPAHGFAVSFADDWTVGTPSPDPTETDRLGMTAVLTSTPPEEGPVCTVYIAPGAAMTPGERLLRPWLEEHGLDEYHSTSGWDMPEGAAGLASEDDVGSTIAAWVIPTHDDALVLECIVPADPRGRLVDEGWVGTQQLLWWGMPPIAESFGTLSAEE